MSLSNTMNAVTEPKCWKGTLSLADESYQVAFACLASSEAVIDRVAWTNASGDIVQAADIVAEMNFEVFRPGLVEGAVSDQLWMHTVALHRYVHMVSHGRR